jgi:hypothetical protein
VRLIVLSCAIVFCAAAARAQEPAANPSAAGVEPMWDMAIVIREIGANATRLLPVLEQLDVAAWVAKGASDTYAEQLESSKQQARAMADEATALARNPEKLSGALQLFFRLEGLGSMLNSLQEGARKYQGSQGPQGPRGPRVAESLAALFAEGGANRERFRDYIVNLAAEREHQFEIMDREAQRCRASLTAPPPPPKTSGRKK